ncbi:MAG: histidine kinase, partial [Bacteroidales bacterium]|nr:histidine kinase [Bacteroidales bacterium]
VYRYVLMSSRHKLVTLEDELTFIRSYIAMHQERLGDGLFVTYCISEDELQRKVPTLSLQFLVENAIKHNIANTKEPLFIEISAQNHLLIVKNNLTPKLSTYSTNTGLRNLKRRIQFLAPDKDLIIRDTIDSFTVKVPTFE